MKNKEPCFRVLRSMCRSKGSNFYETTILSKQTSMDTHCYTAHYRGCTNAGREGREAPRHCQSGDGRACYDAAKTGAINAVNKNISARGGVAAGESCRAAGESYRAVGERAAGQTTSSIPDHTRRYEVDSSDSDSDSCPEYEPVRRNKR